MTRAEQLMAIFDEFNSSACECECEAGDCIADQAMADEIIRLRHALRKANRPAEDAEHHPRHLRDMAEMAIQAAVQIAQSDTSRCLSCGAWV